VSDYELLELVLFRAIPQRDVVLAKDLIARFGSFPEVISAPPARLAETKGIGEAVITELKVVHAAASRLARVRSKTAGAVVLGERHRLLSNRDGLR
jgi:DNA repair protein RadC